MRWSIVVLTLGLAASAGAAGKSKAKAEKPTAKKSTSAKPAKGEKPAKGGGKNTAGAVAGALSDSDRPAAPTPGQADAAPAPHGPQRIDFDDRLIEGQSNKSGAVYLYDRKDLQVDSMVKQPSTFRSEIAKGLFE